ncbi:MAG: 50S ribosomal protein L25 [Chloroflexi bacterium]|nr:50S ribosomal protein L25 [Chloroflexota bacterium]
MENRLAKNIVLNVENRNTFGKKNRSLRRNGITPVHVYGLKSDSLSLQANEKDLISVLKSAGRTTPVNIKNKDGEETITIVREIDRHAVSGDIQHVDFLRVDINEEVESPVPVVLINQDKAPGTAGGAGVVTQGTFEITVKAKPFDMPNELEADCSVLVDLEAAILASDIILGEGVSLSSGSDDRIAWIQPPRVIVEDETVVSDEDSLEGGEESAEENTAEGEQTPSTSEDS